MDLMKDAQLVQASMRSNQLSWSFSKPEASRYGTFRPRSGRPALPYLQRIATGKAGMGWIWGIACITPVPNITASRSSPRMTSSGIPILKPFRRFPGLPRFPAAALLGSASADISQSRL
jgi:hypothetical protein